MRSISSRSLTGRSRWRTWRGCPMAPANIGQLVGDFRNPILKPETADIVTKKGEISKSGQPIPMLRTTCRPTTRRHARHAAWTGDAAEEGWHHHDLRSGRSGSSRAPERFAPEKGDAVADGRLHRPLRGRHAGVDTIGIKPGPYAMVDRYGSPVTEALHVVERYRLIDALRPRPPRTVTKNRWTAECRTEAARSRHDEKRPAGDVTVEDPNVFTTPWSGTVNLPSREPEHDLAGNKVCAENPNEYYKDRWIGLPEADRRISEQQGSSKAGVVLRYETGIAACQIRRGRRRVVPGRSHHPLARRAERACTPHQRIGILVSHPRLYWGETGSVGVPSLIDLSHSLHHRSLGLEPPYPFPCGVDSGLAGLAYVVGGSVTRHFSKDLLPAKADLRWNQIVGVISDHLRWKLTSTDKNWSYNVVQRLTYLAVVFALFPAIIWTGLAMSFGG